MARERAMEAVEGGTSRKQSKLLNFRLCLSLFFQFLWNHWELDLSERLKLSMRGGFCGLRKCFASGLLTVGEKLKSFFRTHQSELRWKQIDFNY
jgi:hypothetical protein